MSERIVPLCVSGFHVLIDGVADVGSTSAASVIFRPTFDDTWDDMSITAKFVNATKTIESLLTNNQNADRSWNIPMPRDITFDEGDAYLTFIGERIAQNVASVKSIENGTGSTLTSAAVTVDSSKYANRTYGDYVFTHDGTNWKYNSTTVTSVLSSTWGITITGVTPVAGDKITISYGAAVVARQTTKPLTFHIYESNGACVASNNEPVTASDRQMLFDMIHVSEAYAKGTVNNIDVEEGDTGYEDNALYYKNQAQAWADGTNTNPGDEQYQNNARYYSENAAAAQTAAETAQAAAETAEVGAFSARSEAVTARTEAVAAKNLAVAAQADAATARNSAVRAQADAATASNSAVTAKDEAISAWLSARDAKDDAVDAKNAANTAKSDAIAAKNAAVTAQTGAESARTAAETAKLSAQEQAVTAYQYAQSGSGDASTASAAKSAAETAADNASSFANGKKVDGTAVPARATDNAKYYAEQAAASAAIGEQIADNFDIDQSYAVGDYVLYNGELYRFTYPHASGASWDSTIVSKITVTEDLAMVLNDIAYQYDADDSYPAGSYTTHDARLYRSKVDTAGGFVPADWEQTTVGAELESIIQDRESHRYDAFATETENAATRIRTTVGAALPLKTATVTQTHGDVPQNWIIRRCGKNLFDCASVTFLPYYAFNDSGIPEYNTAGSRAASVDYIPVIPGSRLVSRGIANTPGAYDYRYRIAFYAADKSYISYGVNIAAKADFAVTVPDNAYFFRFMCANQLLHSNKNLYFIPASAQVQFEILDNPSATTTDATVYEAYSGVDTVVSVAAFDTPTEPIALPTTLLGQNVISLFPQGALTDIDPTTNIDIIDATAAMAMTYRLDPTLACNQLKAAIAALGTT